MRFDGEAVSTNQPAQHLAIRPQRQDSDVTNDTLGLTKTAGGRLSLERSSVPLSATVQLDQAVDAHFDTFLDITAPLLPVQTLLVSVHIMQKRARQFLEDARCFAVQQLIWLVTAMLGLLVPKDANGGWLYLSEVVFALVLVISSLEIIVYIAGHGFFAGEKFGRTASQLRVLAVLDVWSPPRFRRKGYLGANQYHVQTPLLSNSFLRLELTLVLLSIIGYFLEANELGRIRYIHLLRCCRLLYGLANIWSDLIRVIRTFQASFAGIGTAMVLLVFFFVLFGIAGVDQFGDSLQNRCVLHETPQAVGTYNRSDMCRVEECIESSPILYCDSGADTPSFVAPFVCRGNMVCRTVESLNYGYPVFNDFFHASILMLQLTSLTNWSDYMIGLWGANPRILVGIFCVALIIIVSYIVLNFVVATICSAYSECRAVVAKRSQFQSISLLNFRFTEFVWWTISEHAQYHLSYSNPGTHHANRRTPFFYHVNYKIGRDLWLLLLVSSHASLTADSSPSLESYLRGLETANIIIFSLDVVISTVASGSIGKYLVDADHQYDVIAFALTVVGLVMKIPLSVFRFVLVGHWITVAPGFRNSRVLQHAITAVPGTLVGSLVLLLMLFVSASVAVQLFSDEQANVANAWSDPWESIVTLFRFVTLDGWSTIMYDAMNNRGWAIGLAFFAPTYIVFGYIIRGLFTSIVVDAFDPITEDKLSWQRKMLKSTAKKNSSNDDTSTPVAEAAPNVPYAIAEERKVVADTSFFYFRLSHPIRRALLQLVTVPSELVVPDNVTFSSVDETDNRSGPSLVNAEALIPYRCYGSYFQIFIMLFVLGSVVTAADPPMEACTTRAEELDQTYAFTSYVWLDAIIVTVFTIEMLLKMIAHGVMMRGDDRPWYVGPTYVRDWWNLLDFSLLFVMYLSFFYPQVSALRLMRILRPLRIIRRFRRMRLLMQGVFSAIPSIAITLFCGGVMLFLFAVVGVAAFRGRMNQCTSSVIGDTVVLTKADCVGMSFNDDGILVHAAWEPQDPSFDGVIDGMSYLVQIISLSSWTELLARATSVTAVDRQPKNKAALQNSLFFFVFVILANSYVANIVVAVVVSAFDEQRGFRYLTLQQRMYRSLLESMEFMSPIPPPPTTRFPRLLRLVRWQGFDMLLNLIVILNIAVLLSTRSGQSDLWTSGQFYLNSVFTFIFILEAGLKLLALGRHYFSDMWNNIDLFIVIGSVIEFSIQLSSSGQAITVTSIGRAFRILRVFRSVRRIPSLHMMFRTLANATPAIASIFGVMIMVVFMYSVVGMQMFGQLKFQTAITMDSNFRDFLTAWFTVFRMLTLDGWDVMMKDASSYVGESCSQDQPGWWYLQSDTGVPTSCGVLNDCGSLLSARSYFFSFYILAAFVFSTVVVAILLDSFRLSSSSTRAAVRQYDLEGFRTAWLQARKVVGDEFFYGTCIEMELMSLLCISLFNDHNGLCLNRVDPNRHVHPSLTSKTRLNFRKIIYELDMVTERRRDNLRRKLRRGDDNDSRATISPAVTPMSSATTLPGTANREPNSNLKSSAFAAAAHSVDQTSIEDRVMSVYPAGSFPFRDVLEALCRFQMGPDALELEQKFLRERFEDRMNVALFGKRITTSLLKALEAARARLLLYDLNTAEVLQEATPSLDEVNIMRKRRGSEATAAPEPLEPQSLMTSTIQETKSILRKTSFPKFPARNATSPDDTRNSQPVDQVTSDVGNSASSSPLVPLVGVLSARWDSPVDWSPVAQYRFRTNVSSAHQLSITTLCDDEQDHRALLLLEAIGELEGWTRQCIIGTEVLQASNILGDAKREWLRVLFAARLGVTADSLPATNRPPSSTGSAVAPTARRHDGSIHLDNPILTLDTLHALMCPDDMHCPLYEDPRHCTMRRHTCRRGDRCHDFTAMHAKWFTHPSKQGLDEISSDDDLVELHVL